MCKKHILQNSNSNSKCPDATTVRKTGTALPHAQHLSKKRRISVSGSRTTRGE